MEVYHEEMGNDSFLLLRLLFLSVTGTATAGNKVVEEKIVALEKLGSDAIKKKDRGCPQQSHDRRLRGDR